MRRTLQTIALGGALALALTACSTWQPAGTDSTATGYSAMGSSAAGGASSTVDVDGLRNNNGNGEAGATPLPGSLDAASGQ